MLDSTSAQILERRCGVLRALLQPEREVHDRDPNTFEFGLQKPIRTIFSKEYKGDRNDAAEMCAEVTFNWRLCRIRTAPKRFEVHGGGVNVKFARPDGSELRHFHYDVCLGGMDERGGMAHHPYAHFQYGRESADLPRLPTLIFTPTDVLEQVLLDLWPRKWPSTAMGIRGKAALARHYKSQQSRIEISAQRFVDVAKAAKQPLRGLQDRLTQNLAI